MECLEEAWGSSYHYCNWSGITSGRTGKVRNSEGYRRLHTYGYDRSVRAFQTKDINVAKLFAKHIKIQDSINFLKAKRTGIAVGTPKRLHDLMDDGLCSEDIKDHHMLIENRCFES